MMQAPYDVIERSSPLVGRILLSLIFFISGISKMVHWSGTVGYMTAQGMPLVPLFLLLAILFELAGGLSLLLGWRARLGTLVLLAFLIPTTLIFHDFWTYEGMEYRSQMMQFFKNLALMGGLLLLLPVGSGPLSLDALMASRESSQRERARQQALT